MTLTPREFTKDLIPKESQRQRAEDDAVIDVDLGHTAILVVNMLDEFVRANRWTYWIPEATRQVPRGRRLIERSIKLWLR